MYVCICNAIRECELRHLARTCRGGADELYAKLGRPPQCRQCVDEAEDIISEERLGSTLPLVIPAKENAYQLSAA
ncbi:bacterioferritin-associated ferredoxin [Novosphingobium fluoreni]|uniref:Bacterioferritin-associated ferredoxin n=1 Tax=Novosphingobium fluoreni TaxID=1391222 RepID=A0A7W6FYQ4_9SPHN|nr:ferredoxin [Novosphingobium fluoreni]MBB3940739.1 bacterioferritin-associated ferredoxin [Novosphingobium fluoreni]